jgi:hypothetical protein
MAARSPITGKFARVQEVLEELARDVIIPELQQTLRNQDKVVGAKPPPLVDTFDYDLSEDGINVFSTSSYSGSVDLGYNGPRPPYNSIALWIRKRGIRIRNRSGKFVRMTDSYINRTAFAIANKIGREGYVGSNYVGQSYINVVDIITKSLSEAYAEDIRNMLNENISRQ